MYSHQVESSVVAQLGYDEVTGDLWVMLNSGREYVYTGVPQADFEEFVAAPSKGVFYNQRIKPVYPWRTP